MNLCGKRHRQTLHLYMSYCKFVSTVDKDNVHKKYHDFAYGFPIHDDNELFCRLVLEINQAGLSWDTILKKEQNFRKAYHNFDIAKVAKDKEKDRRSEEHTSELQSQSNL